MVCGASALLAQLHTPTTGMREESNSMTTQGRPVVGSEALRFTRVAPQVRRRLLIEAATRCLQKGGIQFFTVDRICREAGVSRGLINHYFVSKDDLLVAVYQSSLYETLTKHITQVMAMPKDAPALHRLRALVDACFLPDTFDRSNLLVWLALWGEVANNPKLRAVHRDLYDTYRRQLAAEIAAVAVTRKCTVDAPRLARSFIALLDGLWLEWCLDEQVVNRTEARAACYDLLESKLGPLR